MAAPRTYKIKFFEQVIAGGSIISATGKQKGLQFLVSFFGEIRPGTFSRRKTAIRNLEAVTQYISNNKILLANFQHAVLSQLQQAKLSPAFTESGIPLARGFWQELSNRLKHKLLPRLQDANDFLYTINHVFYKKNDFKWVEAIPRQQWVQFFEKAGMNFSAGSSGLLEELLHSLRVLSYHVAQLGLEKDVEQYLPDAERQNSNTPFVLQNYAVHELEKLVQAHADDESITAASLQLKQQVARCFEMIQHIRNSHSENGASLQQTYILLLLANRLQRMQLITDMLDADNQFDTGSFADLFRLLVRYEKRKNSIKEFLSQGVGYLAYQIAEHKGKRGNKYITETRRQFYRMIGSAMSGGFIISFIAIFKNLLGKLALAPFPMGFLYSINYSAGFVLIDETKSTLATKQPAFTASAVAASLDSKRVGEPNIDNLAATVAKVSRSQIASFFGNLIIVFPLTFALAWLYHHVYGVKIAGGAAAFALLKAQHPWRSAALLYACFTGVFLFVSGIIAGYWQNKIKYGQIKERLKHHPGLKQSFSEKFLGKLANYVEKHLGALMGSVALGFFLGFSGVVGKIFGIPFDIRHITISAGNTAIGVYGLGIENIPPYFMLAVLGGVLAIGFLNFLISFLLAFVVAVKSRGIHMSEYPNLFRKVLMYFFTHTREFFLPPKKEKEVLYKPLV